jgi:hypothetical protein
MAKLLNTGFEVSRGASGALRITVGRASSRRLDLLLPSPGGWTQDDLQTSLLVYLFVSYRKRVQISRQIAGFLRELQPWLSAEDVETTRTGVTRVMTTTRSSARALREHGLISQGPGTAHRRWVLTIAGLLVAAQLVERKGSAVDLDARGLRKTGDGTFGASLHLSEDVVTALAPLRDPQKVCELLTRLCGPDREVVEAFDHVVTEVSRYAHLVCDPDTSGRGLPERRSAAKAIIDRLSETIPSDVLADAFAKDHALRGVLSSKTH